MKLAIVHDDLIQFGGAERLLLALHELWPEAPVYTSIASKEWLQKCVDENIDLKTSFMQKFPLKKQLNRIYAPFLLYPLAFESFDFSEYDVVLSLSARFAHGIITKPYTKHICYMNSPGRMIWESHNYFEYEKFNKLNLLMPSLTALRLWDFTAAQRVDYFIANSTLPKSRINKYYQRDSIIVYPFVETNKFPLNKYTSSEYFLIISRLLAWKRIDIAIKAFNKLNLPLKIIGEGPEHDRLRSLAASNIEFLGYVSEEEKRIHLSKAAALVVTQHEDFGITPLEAMASGKPVIAYGKGGVLDTVEPGITGVFYPEQTEESLAHVLIDFNYKDYLVSDCLARAKRFDKCRFTKNIQDFVHAVYLES